MKTPVLKSKRFVIRALEKKDLTIFAQYRSKHIVSKYQSWSNYTYQDACYLLENIDYLTFGKVGEWYQLAIVKCESDILIGDLALHFIDKDQIEIGFTVSPEHQCEHVAKEAISSLLSYLFKELKVHRVIAITDTRNVSAYCLLEKLGFRREGHFLKNIFFHNHDTL